MICVGSGNEGNSAGHTAVQLETGRSQEVQFAVSAGEPVLNVQIWKNYTDEIEIVLESPSGQRAGPIQERLGTQRLTLDGTEILLYYGKPSPYSTNQEIYLDFLSASAYVADGIWKIYLIPRKLVLGTVAFSAAVTGGVESGNCLFISTAEYNFDHPVHSAEGDHGGSLRCPDSVLCRFLGKRKCQSARACGRNNSDRRMEARSVCAGSGSRNSGIRRDLSGIQRDLLRDTFCNGQCSSFDGMGDCARK